MSVAYTRAQRLGDAADDLLTSLQVCAAAGITYRQLDHWCREGLVRTEGSLPLPGTGSPRSFSPHERDVIKLAAHLRRVGIGVEQAFKVARSGQSEYRLSDKVTVLIATGAGTRTAGTIGGDR